MVDLLEFESGTMAWFKDDMLVESNDMFTLDEVNIIIDRYKNRVCGNCEYWNIEDTSNGYGECTKRITDFTTDEKTTFTRNTFGCNRWEDKDENK